MKYYTREGALDEIRQRCPHKFGFEHAFARTTMLFIRALMECIDNNKPIDKLFLYTEQLDFLDGNGFIVEGDENNGYTIKLMKGEL